MDDKDLGPFRRIDPDVVDDDPFWSAVRRRHPDVDIVLLPGGEADDGPSKPPQPVPEPDPDQVSALVDEARAAWRLVEPLLVGSAGGADDLSPTVRWSSGAEGGALLVQQALRSLGQDGGAAVLRAVALALGGAGWRLRPSTHQGHPLLEATKGRSHVRAEAGPGATVLTITTQGPAGAGRQAVASWR